jgi:hypothetical protein
MYHIKARTNIELRIVKGDLVKTQELNGGWFSGTQNDVGSLNGFWLWVYGVQALKVSEFLQSNISIWSFFYQTGSTDAVKGGDCPDHPLIYKLQFIVI